MRHSRAILRIRARGDAGSALIAVLMVMALLGALGVTVTVLSVHNSRNATFDRQGDVAQNVSEAGISQAIAWMRLNGTGTLACSPSCNPALLQPDWGQGPNVGGAGPNTAIAADASYGHLVVLPGGQQYRVWIEKVLPFSPPTNKTGVYTAHSVGAATTQAAGTGTRSVSADITVAPFQFPIGVFAHTVAAGGNGGIHYESLFSDSCIQGRQFETFQGIDRFYGIPAGAHSADAIVGKQNAACNQGNSIHQSAACNSSYPNDSDKYGGALAASGCYGLGTFKGSPWLTTSQETSNAAMADFYGYAVNPLGLSNSQLDALRTASQQQGLYYTGTTAIPSVLQGATASTTYPHPVLFYDLKGAAIGGTVDLGGLTGYSRAYPVLPTDAGCKASGAIVVVLNGNVKLNGNTVLTASVFAPGPAPNGQVTKANGAGQLIGTLYADSIDMRGTADIYLDDCFLANLPGSLLNVTVSNYREIDR